MSKAEQAAKAIEDPLTLFVSDTIGALKAKSALLKLEEHALYDMQYSGIACDFDIEEAYHAKVNECKVLDAIIAYETKLEKQND